MPALYSHTTRATGTVLTATIYNGDHQNHIDNGVPGQLDDYSSSVGQMQTNTDPGGIGTESLATSLAGELERIRFVLKQLRNGDQWYAKGSAPGARNLIDLQKFTSSGTWTKPDGATAFFIQVVGGGGAGGGAAATGASQASLGGGGAAGGYSFSFLTSGVGATETVTIGAGGTGVAGAAGNSGGASSFGSLVVAAGGGGGLRDGADSSVFFGRAGTGSLSGAAGQYTIPGANGEHGMTGGNGGNAYGGSGASGPFGGGGGAPSVNNANGGAATANSGGGGGGSCITQNLPQRSGGAGGSGVVLVWSYT